jgi:hypothetical protein
MPKATIWALMCVGFLFFLFGGIFRVIGGDFFRVLSMIGFLAMVAAVVLALTDNGIIRKDQVLDSWGFLIEKAQGRAEEVFKSVDSFVRESKAPELEMERKPMRPGLIRSLAGVSRDFLVVTARQNLRMEPYKVFLNARDYGDNLDVSWYLTFKPTLLQAAVSLIPFANSLPTALSDIDLFDLQDLRAYSTVVHSSVLKSVDKIMFDLNQDPSKMERKSRGFLGIS